MLESSVAKTDVSRAKTMPTPRKRILYITHTAVPGGAELALLRFLDQLDLRRYEPIVLLFAEGYLAEALRRGSVTVLVLPLAKSVNETNRHEVGWKLFFRWGEAVAVFRQVWRIARVARTLDIDLVHTHSLKAALIGGFGAMLGGRPLIWHIHDRIASDYMPKVAVHTIQSLARILPHVLIVNSHSTLRTFLPEMPKYCRVVYPGVNLKRFEQRGVQPAENPRLLVGLVGRISSTKGQDVFIKAAARVLQSIPAARFQIIGSALFNEKSYEDEMRRLIARLGMGSVVELLGFVEDLTPRINELTIVVSASTTPEPFGQVIVEGMACGKPVIATNAGGAPEIVLDGVTGWLVPPSDHEALAEKICWLLHHPERAESMGKEGRRRVQEHFSIVTTARQIESIYESLLNAIDLRTVTPPVTSLPESA